MTRYNLTQRIYRAIVERPGARQADIARAVGIRRAGVWRALPVLDQLGLLVYEDDAGRLFPFERREAEVTAE